MHIMKYKKYVGSTEERFQYQALSIYILLILYTIGCFCLCFLLAFALRYRGII